MRKLFNADVITTGLAAFSMFFGAGNVVFPLVLGKTAGSQVFTALIGFLITAVGLPFLGLIAMSYFDGDYQSFFHRIGRVPGSIFIFIIMALIGPLAAMPRLVTVSHAAIKTYLPYVSLFHFSIFSALAIFIFSVKKNRMLNLLGTLLSPVLLLSLGIIIIKGLYYPAATHISLESTRQMFSHGLIFGYNTMDLYASIFFSTVILSLLKIKMAHKQSNRSDTHLIRQLLQAGGIAAVLLGSIYGGLGLVASAFSGQLHDVPSDELLAAIAYKLLGPWASIVSSVAVALACLTTAITLACVFADFLRNEVLKGKITYQISLAVTLAITTFFANLGFEGIMKLLIPVLSVLYPASIVLTLCNIIYKTLGIKTVKTPVFATLIGTTFWQLLSLFGFLQ